MKTAPIILALFLVSGCALLSEATRTACEAARDAIELYVDAYPDGDWPATQLAIDGCLTAYDADSKRWSLEWEKLKQIIDDALDGFDWLDIFEYHREAKLEGAAEVRIYLDDLKR